MLLKDIFESAVNAVVLKFWSQREKEALLKLVHEIYHSDQEFSQEEEKDFNDKASSLGVDVAQLEKISIDEAVTVLQADKAKKQLMYIILAEAVFKDDDYDKMEKSFVQKLIKKYAVNEDELKEQINAKRDKIMGDVLKDWIKEIDEGDHLNSTDK
jgi:hypothetical protein